MPESFTEIHETIPDEIQFAVEINASADEIFHCMSTVDGWNAWFTSDMSLDAKPGGLIVFHWKRWGADRVSGGDHGKVIRVDPGREFVFTWHPDSPDYSTVVSLVIEREKAPYILRVTESGFENSPEGLHAMIHSSAGWGEALTLLKMYLEHGISQVNRGD